MNLNGKLVHIFNSHGIGDVIMSLPMIKILLAHGARVLITVKGPVESSVIKAVLDVELHQRMDFLYFSNFKGVVGTIKYIYMLRKHNIDCSLPSVGIHNVKYNILSWLSGARYRIGCGGRLSFFNHKNLIRYSFTHKVEKNLEIVNFGFGVDVSHMNLPAYIREESSVFLSDGTFTGKTIALAPSSGELESHKRWPIDSFRNLAKRLTDSGHTVVILGGPGEEKLGQQISSNLSSEFIHNYVGKLSIKESFDCLSQCDVLIANCNGLSHMGSLIPTLKIIGLYGPTNPFITGPYRSDLVTIRLGLDCSPCYRRGFIKGCGNPICMEKISVATVEREVLNMMEL